MTAPKAKLPSLRSTTPRGRGAPESQARSPAYHTTWPRRLAWLSSSEGRLLGDAQRVQLLGELLHDGVRVASDGGVLGQLEPPLRDAF